jgi:uncharacterized membrane protein YoaK (UPF0700 family)
MRIGGGFGGDWETPVLLVLSFMVGSSLCGFVVAHNEVHFGKSLYGIVLLGNAALLIIATQLNDAAIAPYMLACACGLQNGMCTMHFGAVVRTTHVTGLVTDLGLSAGRVLAVLIRMRCRSLQPDTVERAQVSVDAMKLRLLFFLGLGFFVGVSLGGHLAGTMGINALFVPAAVTGVSGLLCAFFRNRIKASLKSVELAALSERMSELQGLVHAYCRGAGDVQPSADVARMDVESGDAQKLPEDVDVVQLVDRLQRGLTKIWEVHDQSLQG